MISRPPRSTRTDTPFPTRRSSDLDAVAKQVRRKTRPTHTGDIDLGAYRSEDGGPRLQRSVIDVRSCHGHAEHPTQKPLGIIRSEEHKSELQSLMRTSYAVFCLQKNNIHHR